MAERKKVKTKLLSVRITPKTQYGLALLAQRYRQTLSEVVGRAIDSFLISEGLGAKPPEVHFSMLDILWSPSESERLYRVVSDGGAETNLPFRVIAEELLPPEDFATGVAIRTIIQGFERMGGPPTPYVDPSDYPNLWQTLDSHLDEIRRVANTPVSHISEWNSKMQSLAEKLFEPSRRKTEPMEDQ